MSNEFAAYYGWVGHRPLDSLSDAFLDGSAINVKSSVCVRKEEATDPTPFEKFCQLDPVGQLALCC